MKYVVGLALLILSCLGVSAQVYGDPIVHWQFEDGIPESWSNESLSGIGVWEYRGPDTEPDNSVCANGSCSEGSIPPNSLTLDNGFVIFDSNYWDDPEVPCGTQGAGPDPGPHEAWLITESVDLSEEDVVVITFQQQYKHYITSEYDVYSQVQVSIDGGDEWQTIIENPADFATSANVEWAGANITDIVSGQSDVRFRFLFTGYYYWWCIDDIILYVPNDNDLLLLNRKFTEFDGNLAPDGFGDMEYNMYPQLLLPTFNFTGEAVNIGGLPQNNTKLEVSITNLENDVEIFNSTSAETILSPGSSTVLTASNTFSPSTILGHYNIEWLLTQDEEDENLFNNFAEEDYFIDVHTLARDENEAEDQYFPPAIYEGEQVEIGNVFHCWSDNRQIHSISVALGDSTTVGTEIYGIIYDLARDTIFGQTEPYTVNAWDLNSIGESKFVCLPLIEPVITQDTIAYLAMVGHEGGLEERMHITRSGPTPPFSSLLYFPEITQLFYLEKCPMVRIHVFNATFTPGCTDPFAMNYDENASIDDGCCRYPGCTFEEATNYDPDANFDDGSCNFLGCTDTEADNYNPNATEDDGSCEYWGCTDPDANNYDATANVDDGTCEYNEAAMAVDATSGCTPATITVNNQTDVLPDGECEFNLGDGTIITTCEDVIEHVYDTAGEYYITYTYTVGEFESTAEIGPIIVSDPPAEPIVSYNSETNTLSCDCNEDWTIQWLLDGNPVGPNSSSWSPGENGLYSVQITDPNDCSATSEPLGVIIVGLETFTVREELLLYPNPASTWLQTVVPCEDAILTIHSSNGALVGEHQYTGSRQAKIDLDQAPGVYVVTIRCNELVWTKRLIIKP